MKRFSNILLISDDASENSVALDRAIRLARNNQAELTFTAVVESIPKDMQMAINVIKPDELTDLAVAEKRAELQKIIDAASELRQKIEIEILVGNSFLEIIRQVLRNNHDLIIKCAEPSKSLKETLFGSTDMHLLRKCPCPVWLIKPSDHDHYNRVLAAVDWDEGESNKVNLNNSILEMATSLALAESEELHIVHAWELVGEELFRSQRTNTTASEVDAMVSDEENKRKLWLQDLEKGVSTSYEKASEYLKPTLHLPKGPARHVIPAMVRELDVELVIMGTVGRTGIPGFFMGNTAESILNQIDCAVLALKPPGFNTPVTLR